MYGWFARLDRGIYELTEAGRAALVRWPQNANTTERLDAPVPAF
ncbi:hypothetical protein CEV34_3721 [Brucella pseudogrignonensis]|uniref:Uncharacterized protein n=1 Tax=Brucella pseudogrignonensis TaxID=419475 RepID=A0A256G9B5_9HYPH|nr:hypothetical protein CEV34_3721 [Brucella pseudogrignonensis]